MLRFAFHRSAVVSAAKRFRWIVLEDDADWQDFLREEIPQNLSSPAFVGSLDSLLRELAKRPAHLLSLDQNVPEKDEGQSMTTQENGLRFLEQIQASRPLVRTAIYTAYSKPRRAHLAGQAGAEEYIEKSFPRLSPLSRPSPEALAPRDYMNLLGVLLQGGIRPHTNRQDSGYVPWALERGTRFLPPFLALHCRKIANAIGRSAWEDAFRQLFKLREQAIIFAWAHAAALCRAFRIQHTFVPREGFNGIVPVERDLLRLWEALNNAKRLGVWKGYVTEQDETGNWRSTGGALFGDTQNLRVMRNSYVHTNISFSRTDYELAQTGILAIIHALAFWADNPLMIAMKNHTDRTGWLEFDRLAGNPPFLRAELASTAIPQGTMDQRQERIHVLHRDDLGEHLVNLHPFVTMKSLPRREPLPCVLIPPQSGSKACWVSLLDYSLLSDLKVEKEDEAAIFGP
jgi:CheY-like chemotaxis protein